MLTSRSGVLSFAAGTRGLSALSHSLAVLAQAQWSDLRGSARCSVA